MDCGHRRLHHWHGHYRPWRIAGMVIVGLAVATLVALVFGLFVKLLWNWLMPALFGLGEITYWQGFGLVFLSRLLFGNFGGPGRRHHNRPPWHRHRGECGFHEEDWKIDGSWRNWDHYDEWWQAEGKAAFQAYADKAHGENGAQGKE